MLLLSWYYNVLCTNGIPTMFKIFSQGKHGEYYKIQSLHRHACIVTDIKYLLIN